MSLSFARNAPMSVQIFCWAFLVRPPLQDEVPEVQALLASLRKRWRWLAGIYLVFLAVLVLPGVLRERGADYTIAAVTLPHLLLLLMLSLSLTMWAGFRINLGNVGKVYLQNRRRWSAAISIAVLFAMGFFAGLFGGDVHDRVRVATRAWLDDTLTPAAVGFLLIVMVLALPELVARMRQQQHALSLRLAEAQTAQERLARVTAESELRLLQAQVEPHFLYNTLANLRFLVQTGSPDALRMTDALIEYLQTSVPDMRAQQVTLGREADHARHYLDIMQMRMAGRLHYTIDVPAELRDVALPPLVLLTLVENAVKHGIAPLVEGGRISLGAHAEGERVVITVDDDGAGLQTGVAPSTPAGHGGTGLSNISARLALVYGGSAELQLTAAEPRGTRAVLRLPRLAPQASTANVEVEVLVLTEDKDTAAGPPADSALPATLPRPTTERPA
jgi:signal transduction histidine kinase